MSFSSFIQARTGQADSGTTPSGSSQSGGTSRPPEGFTRDGYGNIVRIDSLSQEEQRYQKAALESPEYQKLLDTPDSQQTPEELFMERTPGALGQYLTRWGPGDNQEGGTFNYSQRETAAGIAKSLGQNVSGLTDSGAGDKFLSEQSASAQASRDKSDGFGSFLSIAIPVALSFTPIGAAMASSLGTVGSGAVTGALTSAISGGDPLKGAVLGAAGGALGGATSGMKAPSGIGNLTTGQIANAAGRVALGTVGSGGDISRGLVSGASGLIGSSVGNETGSRLAGTIASGVTRAALNMATSPEARQTTQTQAQAQQRQQPNSDHSAADIVIAAHGGGSFGSFLNRSLA